MSAAGPCEIVLARETHLLYDETRISVLMERDIRL